MKNVGMLNKKNLQAIFNASANAYLILLPDSPRFTIVEANEAYFKITGAGEDDLQGQAFEEAFPEVPDRQNRAGLYQLRISLECVLANKTPHRMPVIRYDIPVRGTGEFTERYWHTENIPVLGEEGEVDFIIHTTQDVTSQVHMERHSAKVSNQLQEHYHSLFEHNPDAVYSFDMQGNFLSVNPAAAKLVETTREELLRLTFMPLIADEDKDRVFDHFLRAADGKIQRYSCGLITVRGNRRTIDVTNMPIVVEGEIVGVYGIAKDVTELREAEQVHERAYQLAHIGTWEFDMETHELYWSDVTKQVHGFGPDYQPDVESTIALFKEGEHRETFARAARNAIEHEQPFDVELKIISGQGDERWIRATGEPEYKNGVCTRFYGISQNVSNRHEAEQKYKDLFNFNPLPMWTFETGSLRFLEVNQAAIDHYGYSREEFLQMTLRDIRPAEDVARLEDYVSQTEAIEEKRKSVWQHLRKDGQLIYVRITVKDIPHSGQGIRLVLAEDIIEQLQKTRALTLSEQRFKALVQDGGDLIGILDAEANYTYVSPTSKSILGIPPEELVGTNALDYIHEADRPRIERILSELPEARRTHIAPLRFRDSTGRWRWIETTATNMLEDPAVEGIVANSRDVTERIRRDRVLQKTNERLRAAQNIAKLGHWTHDLVEDISNWSKQVYEIWEVDSESFTPSLESVVERVHPEDREVFRRPIEEAFPDQDFYDLEHRIITPAGKTKWVLERITLHRDEQGQPKLMEGIAQDITEHKRQEEKLRASLQEKEVLLAEVHHRVKNNLAVVSAMMQLQAFEEANKDLRDKLMNSVTRIQAIAGIHEHLYQNNSFAELNLAANLEQLIAYIEETLQPERRISFDLQLDSVQLNVNQAIPVSLIANEVVTNALKYAFPEKPYAGTIQICLQQEDEFVAFSVADNGVGLPEDFGSGGESKTLGLLIIDNLARQLRAEYSYAPTGEGSEFLLRFRKSGVKGIGNSYL